MLKRTHNPHLNIVEGNFNNYIINLIKENMTIRGLKKVKLLDIGGGKGWGKVLYSKGWIDYHVLDLNADKRRANKISFIKGDITDDSISNIDHKFDILFTFNTFEHILNPWDATQNILNLLNEDGLFIFAAPFSWRYHPSPYDTYRYTHTGAQYIFERLGGMKRVEAGYVKLFQHTTKGFWKNKNDLTLDGQVFPKPIQAVYVGKRDSNHKFSHDDLDSDFAWNHKK